MKIDRAFAAELADAGASTAIVRAMIELAHAVGLTLVAEGVETTEQLSRLRELGCDPAQGFHIGKPMSAPNLEMWLADEAGRYRE